MVLVSTAGTWRMSTPPVITWARPSAALREPRVTINGGTLALAMRVPFRVPHAMQECTERTIPITAGLPVASAVGFLPGAFSVLIAWLHSSNRGPRSSPPRALRQWCLWLEKSLFVDQGGAPGRDRTPEERPAWNG